MDETPDEPRRGDDDKSGQQDEPTGEFARGEPLPPGFPTDPTTPNQPGGLPRSLDDANGDAEDEGDVEDEDQDDDDYDETARSRPRLLSGRLVAGVVVVLALLGAGVGLALTGGGDDEDDPDAGQADDQQAAEDAPYEYAECVREHGIEDFPDPQVDDNGIDAERCQPFRNR